MDNSWRNAHPACELAVLATRPGPLTETTRLCDVVARVADWEQCRRVAADHGVAELVYQRLGTLIAERCPPDIWQRWGVRCQSVAIANMAGARALTRIIGVFERVHVPVLAVKGPLLGLAYYGDLGLRPFEDLDLLVRPEDRERAITALCELGFVPRYALTGALQRGYFQRFGELHLTHTRAGTVIDLHWSLLWSRCGFAAALDGSWERTATVSIGRVSIRTLGTEDLLVYLLIHAAKHAWGCLSWLGDIARVIQGPAAIDWSRIVNTANRTGSNRLLGTGLAVCTRLLDAHAPELSPSLADAADQRLVRDICWQLLHAPRLNLPGPGRPLFFRALERKRDRMRWAQEVLLDPTPPDWDVVALPTPLGWLYPAVRAGRLLRKYGSRAAREHLPWPKQ
jgi:hypothetical protein